MSGYELWNPHVIRKNLRRAKYEAGMEFIPSTKELADEVRVCVAEFRSAYAKAKAQVPGDVPLAYRLEPTTVASTRDNIWVPKFGGLPDLYHEYFYKSAEYDYKKNKASITHWTPEEYVEHKWPRCKCCGKPLIFIGQLEFTAWLNAIHHLTLTVDKSNHECFWKSGVGCTQVFGKYDTARTWMKFWYCPAAGCSHFSDYGVPAAAVTYETRTNYAPLDLRKFKKGPGLDRLKETERGMRRVRNGDAPWPKRAYGKALRAFAKEHKIERMPVELIHESGYNLRFDLDPKEHISWRSKLGKKLEKFFDKLPPLFKKDGDFQLFGTPDSQQADRRYICNIRWPKPHATAPLLNWTDNAQDVTHQMYGCLGCAGQDSRLIHCKMDSSCT